MAENIVNSKTQKIKLASAKVLRLGGIEATGNQRMIGFSWKTAPDSGIGVTSDFKPEMLGNGGDLEPEG